MIYSKNVRSIKFHREQVNDFRPQAFGIYLKLLRKYQAEELLLLESLGNNEIDSRASLIGIKPLLSIEVSDCLITIRGNPLLLQEVSLIYKGETLVDSGADFLYYRISVRNRIWDFLRKIDCRFNAIEGGVLAFMAMGYNTIHYIEDLTDYDSDMLADITLTCFATCIEFQEKEVKIHEYGFIGEQLITEGDLLEILMVEANIDRDSLSSSALTDFSIERETKKEAYILKTEKALRHIQMGDVYQVQIGQKLQVRSSISPLEVYARMRLLNPSPYMYLFHLHGHAVVGASPELFVRIQNDEVLMRPIAGTLGKMAASTKELATIELRNNAKEVAEHLMLVDLCRNDLSRIATPQSLEVLGLLDVEEYSHVFHMVTTTRALLKEGMDKYDVIKAAFPAGTMTGTPKIRAMEIIADLEDSGRGLYAGALGMIGLGTEYINTALCIRTATESGGVYTLRASAGIVSDSIVENEHAETLHKMGSVFKAITGEEIACHLA